MGRIPSKPSWRLWTLGGITLMIYGVCVVFYGMKTNHFTKEVFIVPVTLCLASLYLIGWRWITQQANVPVKGVFGFGLAFGLLALFIPPFDSSDVFGYINRGWQQVHYGLNPYVHTVKMIPQWETDPMFTSHWIRNPSPYGFLFMLYTRLLVGLGQGSLPLTLLLFKLGNLLFFALTGWLVYDGAKRLNLPRPDVAAYLYLWNPLMIMQSLANGHNDILMAFCTLAGVYAALSGFWVALVPLLTAGVLIKYIALVTVPAGLWLVIRQKGWLVGGVSLLLSCLLFLVAGLAYLPDLTHFRFDKIGSNATVMTNSAQAMLFDLYKNLAKVIPVLPPESESAMALSKKLFFAGFIVFYATQARQWLLRQPYTIAHFIHHAVLVQFILVGLAASKFYPWYFAMFFPLACLLPQHNLLKTIVIVTSATHLLAFTFMGQAHIANYLVLMILPVAWIIWQSKKMDAPAEV